MQTADHRFTDFVAAVMDSDTVALRWQRLTGLLGELGFDQVNYGFLDTSAADRLNAPVRFLSTLNNDWISHYGQNRFDADDPHVTLVRSGNLDPYVWRIDNIACLERKAERDVIKMAAEEGLRSQLHVTLPDSDGSNVAVAGMAIGSSLPSRDFAGVLAGMEPLLITMAHLFHNRSIGEIKRVNDGGRPLTPREKDCLRYLTRGLRIDAIADRLTLSRATVEMHLANARRKLKAATLHEAIAKAIRWQEIRS